MTDVCQYNCPYCLPGSLKNFTLKKSTISADGYGKIAKILSSIPISKIRFTGGEPLLRPDLNKIIDSWRRIIPYAEYAITTNAQLFPLKFNELALSGIDYVNVHIDTMKQEKYEKIMGKGNLEHILISIEKATEIFKKIKLNMVLQKGVNDEELFEFLKFSKKTGIMVRFIELMNTGSAQRYASEKFMSKKEAIEKINTFGFVEKIEKDKISDPAEKYIEKALNVEFGIIASESAPFCASCDRLRLGVNGVLKTCLYSSKGLDLLPALENQKNAIALEKKVTKVINNKVSLYSLFRSKEMKSFSMSEIGG